MHRILIILGLIAAAFVIMVIGFLWGKEKDFNVYLDASGVPIFLLSFFGFGAIALWAGWL